MTDDGSKGPERRRERRYETQIDVDVKAEGTFLFAQITDISAMGIFIHAEEISPMGTELTLKFGLPARLKGDGAVGETPLEVRGEVVWTTDRHGNRAPGMGVKFVDLPDAQRTRLMDLINAIAYFDD